jgi:hypothetical protein
MTASEVEIEKWCMGCFALLPVGAAQRITTMGICRLRHRSVRCGIYGY